MGYQEGADLGLDFKYPYQHFNRMKNHWRQSDPVSALTDAQPGMIASDSDDDRLHHFTGSSPGSDEILQENFSHDSTPVFSALRLDVIQSNVSDPPTEAELTAIFGNPWSVGEGWFKFLWDGNSITDKFYVVISDGINWRYLAITAAV